MSRVDGWHGVYLSWEYMLSNDSHSYQQIITWIKGFTIGLHHITNAGTSGYTFTFKRPEDAMMFALKWA
jgi:hypothetical protein